MGNVYARTYFPVGYSEWTTALGLTSELLKSESVVPIDQKLYDEYVTSAESRKKIMEIAEAYDAQVIKISTNMDLFLEETAKSEIAENRLVYDSCVAKVFCDFWLKLIDQPIESIQSFYKSNVPNVEDTFYQVETKYNLAERFPAAQTLWAYKRYCC